MESRKFSSSGSRGSIVAYAISALLELLNRRAPAQRYAEHSVPERSHGAQQPAEDGEDLDIRDAPRRSGVGGEYERRPCTSLGDERHENGDSGDEEHEDREPGDAARRAAGAANPAAPARGH